MDRLAKNWESSCLDVFSLGQWYIAFNRACVAHDCQSEIATLQLESFIIYIEILC
jgi:hypothetical protein